LISSFKPGSSPPYAQRAVAIAIPVKNEDQYLLGCLDALDRAAGRYGMPLPTERKGHGRKIDAMQQQRPQ